MSLVNMRDMLNHAYSNGYAVGGFDLVSLDFLEAIVAAAEVKHSPVILSLAESHFEFYDFELAVVAAEQAAKRASVPMAIHLDHGASYDSAVRAINLGCNGVMVDASHSSFDENVAMTKQVVDMAHACGVPVEGELGYVAGVEGEDAEKHPGELVYTSIEEASSYVAQTGVDLLAVSVGTVHGRMKGQPKLDFDRLNKINASLNIPLVIHGGTGLSDDQFKQLITGGVAKINYYTALADAAGNCMRDNVNASRGNDYTGITKGIQRAMRDEIERCMECWGSAGKADAVLSMSTKWQPVHHVIIFNVENTSDEEAQNMMQEGERILSKIPGVRRINTASAITQNAKFQYSWLIEFVHPNVIDSYREHPDHVAFADKLFRPIAGDRISIDYLQNPGMT